MIKCQSIRHSTQGRTRYELPGLNIPGLVFKESWLPHIQGVEHRVNMVHVIFIHRGERLVPILVLVNSDDNWDIGAHAIIFLVQRALPCARLRCCIWYPSMFFMFIFFDPWSGSHKEWRLWKSYLLRATATAAYLSCGEDSICSILEALSRRTGSAFFDVL